MRRVVLVLSSAAVAVLLPSLYGCGQPSSPAENKESKEGVERIAGDEPTREEAAREKQPQPKTCEDFYGPQDAQAYFDGEATPEEKKTLDADGDGWACNEGRVAWKPEGETTTATTLQVVKTSGSKALRALPPDKPMTAEDMEKLNDLNDYDRSVILGLLDCQFTKYAAIHGQQAAEEHLDELLGDALSSSPSGEAVSIQERMMSEGFTCSLNEIIETQAATSYGAEE